VFLIIKKKQIKIIYSLMEYKGHFAIRWLDIELNATGDVLATGDDSEMLSTRLSIHVTQMKNRLNDRGFELMLFTKGRNIYLIDLLGSHKAFGVFQMQAFAEE